MRLRSERQAYELDCKKQNQHLADFQSLSIQDVSSFALNFWNIYDSSNV